MNAPYDKDITLSMMRALYRKRPADAHKGQMGHALLIAGSRGVAGCAILAAESCMRSGVGKLTVFTPEENRIILQIAIPEAIVSLQQPTNWDAYQAVGIGPGIGLEAEKLVQKCFSLTCPIILDADALTIMAMQGWWPTQGQILTPHPKEMERLSKGLQLRGENLFQQAAHLAQKAQCHVILKGHYTRIFSPEGKVYRCPRGNAGMATAGSGDVLTGILTGLRARGYTAHEAALLGTWLHASAGDLAAQALGEESMLARDITRFLPQAYREISGENKSE